MLTTSFIPFLITTAEMDSFLL